MDSLETSKVDGLTAAYKIGNEIGNHRFHKAMASNVSRYNQISPVVFDTLRESLYFQLHSHIDYGFRKAYRESSGSRNIPLNVLLKQASKDLLKLADGIAAKEGIKIAKKHQRYHFEKKSLQSHDKYVSTLNTYFLAEAGICSFLNGYNGSFSFCLRDCLSGFDAGCFVSEIKDFVTCLDTLVSPTGLASYERMLGMLISRDDYWGPGCYPKDILCIDRLALSGFYGEDVIDAIAVNKSYASSQLIKRGGDSNIDPQSFDIFPMAGCKAA